MDIAWVHLISGRTACSLSQLVVCSGVLFNVIWRYVLSCPPRHLFHQDRHPDLFCQGSALCKSDCDGSPKIVIKHDVTWNWKSGHPQKRKCRIEVDSETLAHQFFFSDRLRTSRSETNMLHVWICCLAYWLDFVGLCGKLPGNYSWMFIPPNMVQVMCYINKPSQ